MLACLKANKIFVILDLYARVKRNINIVNQIDKYNKDTLKNGHQTDATWINRSRSGTRKLVKSKRCFPEVQGRRRFRWIQLKNSFIVAAYMIGKLFPHGMPYRYNLKQVPTQMPVRHRLKYRDVGIRLPVMFC